MSCKLKANHWNGSRIVEFDAGCVTLMARKKQALQQSIPATFLGEDLIITGNVVSTGKLHIRGDVEGEVKCESLVIEETAKLAGTVVAREAVIIGRLFGTVRASRIVLQAKSRVDAALHYDSLAIEKGAQFEGESRKQSHDV